MKQISGYRAIAKYLRISPKKMRPVADLVRGKSYEESLAILENLPNKGARMLKKIIASAGANALYKNKNLDEDMLYVKELRVDEGPRLKRVWPRSRGRADLLLKRMSHVVVILDEKQNLR